jgi:aminoglycoside phosphotransferase (APT) family kinase protein
VLDMIDEADLTTTEDVYCTIHGDFKPDQLLVGEGKTWLVDLDRAGLGDPAVDVGNVTAALRKQDMVNERQYFGPLPEAFLARYLELRPGQALAKRARIYHAMALVRMVLARFERAPRSYAREGDAWPWLALLDEASRCLAAP